MQIGRVYIGLALLGRWKQIDGSIAVTGPVACAMIGPSPQVAVPVAVPPRTPQRRKTTASSLQFKSILDEALNEYKEKTGNDLLNNWLAKEIESCNTVEDVLGIVQGEANAFDKFRGGKTLMKWIGPSLRVLYKISSIVGSDAVSVRII